VEGLEDDAEKEGALSPEMLVDALSGQADGLVSIAERLMEYYDDGYDAMGEAIIDAFADVQKLFQHVVEAAHMEGAAFEASRRDAEKLELDNNNTSKHNITMTTDDDPTSRTSMGKAGGPLRHDELIDQDVKDLLSEALNEGVHLKEKGELTVCYRKYEEASQSASAMLPVDSEHRGRLQLAITRADAMHPARGCAILKYAMDDVIRSGLRPGNHSLPDPSKRSDCVLTKPKDDSNLNDSGGGVSQSSEEVLANLVAEMKEVTGAPIYNDTPLQSVATRFWDVLAETQTSQAKKEQSLEHELGQQKGEFLLARAEWEEKLNESKLEIKKYKKKFNKLRETKRGEDYMEQARASSVVLTESRQDEEDNINNTANINPKKSSSRTFSSMGSTPGSVASIGSSMAQHAKTLVREFNCGIMNDRTKTVVNDSMDDEERNKFCENVKKEKTILKLPKEPRVSGTNGSSKGSMSIRTPGESTKRQTAEI